MQGASASLSINRITGELWCMGRNHHAASVEEHEIPEDGFARQSRVSSWD